MTCVSIITINLNNSNGLGLTLQSIKAQSFTNYEHIIIDGGSTDGSVNIIKEYSTTYNGIKNGLYWVSEPDSGIYNAMNKGIKVAKGDYCLFLNSGDSIIENNGLEEVVMTSDFRSYDLIYCNLKTPKSINVYSDKLTLYTLYKGSLPHPSTFIKIDLFYQIGLYDENLKIVSDWSFFLNALIFRDIKYKHFNYTLSFFEENGISFGNESKIKQAYERQQVYNNLPLFINDSANELIFYKDMYNGLISSKSIRIVLELIKLKNRVKRLFR